jgi:hypothetical protein
MPTHIADPNLWMGKGLWAAIAVIVIFIIFWIWAANRNPSSRHY